MREPAEISEEKLVDEPRETESAPARKSTPESGLTAELLYELLLSSIAFQEGEVDLASEALIKAAGMTHDPMIVARAVRMAVHSENYDQAVPLGQRWIELAPDDHQAYIITALAAVMDGQAELAREVLTTLIEQDTEQTDLRFGQIGEVLLQHASGQVAQDVLYALANQYPDMTEPWLVLAGMAQKNKDFPVMDAALDRILRLEPGSDKAAAYKLLALEGDLAAQEAFATRFLNDYPETHNIRMQYAQLLLRNEKGEAALDQLLSLLKHDPQNSEAMNLVALLYQAREDYENAAEYFVMRIRAVPEDDRSRLYLANAYQKLQRYDEAKAVLAAVSGQEEQFNAQRQMSMLIEEADGVDAALKYLQMLQGENLSQRNQIIIDREAMLQRAGRAEEAYALIDSALKEQPDNDTLRYHRALIAAQRNDLETHEADMRILIAHKPDDPHYNNTLGYSLLVMSDRLEEAAVLINQAHTAKPEDPYILDSKGWLEYKFGNLDLALEYLLKAFEQDRDAEIAAHIGEIYWVKGEEERARDYWREGDKVDPKNKSLIDTKGRFLD